VEDLVRYLDGLSSQLTAKQRSREQGELIPGDCGGRLKKKKLMAISAPFRQKEGELRTSGLSPFPTKFRVSFRPLQKVHHA
jgi:hypothetical protein